MSGASTEFSENSIDPEVASLFTRLFPSIELKHFYREISGYDGSPYGCAIFTGTETELLGHGLVTPAMLPVLPKRVSSTNLPVTGGNRIGDLWHITRVKGGRFKVRADLVGVLKDHPLAPFAVWNRQTVKPVAEKIEEPEATQTAAQWKDQRLDWFKSDLAYCASRHWKGHESCFRFSDTDSKRMESMIRKFSNELLDVMTRCQVIDARRPQLRLVVSNAG